MTSSTDLDGLEKYDLYRIVKLNTGETLICTMVDEGEKEVTFEYPIAIEFVKIVMQTGIKHELSAIAYCPFASTRTFTIPRSDVQHINDLDQDMVRSYLRMVYGPMEQSIESVPEGTVLH